MLDLFISEGTQWKCVSLTQKLQYIREKMSWMESASSTFSFIVYQNRIHSIKWFTDSVRVRTEMHVKSSHKVSAILVSFDQKQNV